MPTNKELQDKIKKLNVIIREMKDQLQVHAPKEDELTKEVWFLTKVEDDYYFYEAKFNPKTDEILITNNEKFRTRDRAIVNHEATKRIVCEVTGRKRENF